MAAPRWLRFCWLGLRACTGALGTLFLWSLWLLLCATLIVQLLIATTRELALPAFALREIEARLAEAGLRATFGATRFDPTGQVLVEDLRLWLGPLSEPVLTARSINLQIDPWALLIREVQIENLTVDGGDILVPAMLSPSGQTEALLRNIHARLEFPARSGSAVIDSFTAHAGDIALHVAGPLPAPARARQAADRARLGELASAYPRLARQAAVQLARLPRTERANLSVYLRSDENTGPAADLVFSADRVELPTIVTRLPEDVTVVGLTLRLSAPIAEWSTQPTPFEVRASCGHIESDSGISLEQTALRLAGKWQVSDTAAFPPWEAQLTAARVRALGWAVDNVALDLAAAQWPEVAATLSTRVADEAWALAAVADLRRGSGRVDWQGALSSELVKQANRYSPRDLTQLLQVRQSPRIEGTATFENRRPVAARVRVQAVDVVARDVPLDAASGELSWSGDSLRADDIVLKTGASEARGRYEMNLATRDFRFLLHGRLYPENIDGWFRDWWPRFWSAFAFGAEPPEADVDIQGRWGTREGLSVFVAADGAPVAIKGASFDRGRTRLLFRPGYTDVIEFIANRDGNEVRGAFTHTFDFTQRSWTRVTFEARGVTDLEPASHLFGSLGEAITRPFRFKTPPRLNVSGTVTSPAAAEGRTADVWMEGDTVGDWTFFDFPLNGLNFEAHLLNDVLLVDEIDVQVAGGRARGRVELSGFETEQRLAFDASLTQARLGETIRTLEEWSARRENRTVAPVSRFQRQVAGGRLDLALSAAGNYRDPYSLRGAGHTVVTGADLAEINLLGVLSSLLRPTILNFTTLQLDTALGNFDLKGRTLDFKELRLTGPRAAIDAEGTYQLDTRLLSFLARVRPFDTPGNLLSATVGAVLTPLTSVLEVKLTGRLDQPSWAFVYGPTALLRAIAGDAQPLEAAPGVQETTAAPIETAIEPASAEPVD